MKETAANGRPHRGDLAERFGKKWEVPDNSWYEEGHPVNRGRIAALLVPQRRAPQPGIALSKRRWGCNRSDRLHPHLRLLSAIPGCGALRCGTSSAAMRPRFTGWPSSYQLLSGTSHFLPNRSAKSPRCGRPFAAVSFIALSPTTALYSHTHRYVTSGLNAAIGLECLTV